MMIKEACVETYKAALQAEKNGASRIELCSHLEFDGLTPSEELIRLTSSILKIPVMVMIRPRAGNFIYSNDEVLQMKHEIDIAKQAGAAGVVFGLLTPENTIDFENTWLLAEHAKPLPVTFHKAIDLLENQVNGVKELLKIENIKRILTSGGKPTAAEGAHIIMQMVKAGGDKISIIAAGKITSHNIFEIEKLTGATEFHGKLIVGNLIE